MLTIDFENVYPILRSSMDLRRIFFFAEMKSGKFIELIVEIEPIAHPTFPNFYELAFGPVRSDGSIDVDVRPKYKYVAKVLSTVLSRGLIFLFENKECSLILDGSSETRTVMYHQILRCNQKYLAKFFRPLGIDWYVRRKRDDQYERDDNGELLPRPLVLDFDYDRTKHQLYKYYALKL